jgi:hypothetical protein
MTMGEKEQARGASWPFTILFVFLISAPLIGTFMHWDFYPLQNENRPIAQIPRYTDLPVLQWPEKTTGWFNDHFGFRNTFIRRYNAISRDWFARQPNSVVISDTGWLFTSLDGALADFMGLRILSEDESKRLYESQEGKQNWLREQGIGYLWVIAPNKAVIYPEKLPEALQKARKRDGIEHFMDYLNARNSTLHRLDLRETLLKHKKDGMLYFSNDTHWNPLGSYYGYCALIEAVQRQIPKLGTPLSLADCTMIQQRWTGDLIAFVGDGKNRDIDYLQIETPKIDLEILEKEQLPDAPTDPISLLVVHNPGGHGTAVVFHDSFGNTSWRKLLPYHFRKTIFLVAPRAQIELYKYAINRYNPDIIIEEQVHRNVLHKKQPESKEWSDAFIKVETNQQPVKTID